MTTGVERELRERVRTLEAALYRCAELAGADTSGGAPTWPPIEQWAVQEVEQLRVDYENALDEIPLTPTQQENT